MRDARIHHDATHEVRGAGHREISCTSCVFTDKVDKVALKGQKARQVLRAGEREQSVGRHANAQRLNSSWHGQEDVQRFSAMLVPITDMKQIKFHQS